jgi:hypothetical protein
LIRIFENIVLLRFEVYFWKEEQCLPIMEEEKGRVGDKKENMVEKL